jgi:hypothetical protein
MEKAWFTGNLLLVVGFFWLEQDKEASRSNLTADPTCTGLRSG